MIAAAALLALLAHAAPDDQWDQAYEGCELRVADLPAAAPRFTDYPAVPAPILVPAAPRLRTHDARLFRTQLRTQAKEGPDFAGHDRGAVWGCGTGCASFAVVDLKTGRVYFPPGFKTVEQIAAAPLDHFTYRLDSRLLIVTGAPNEDFKRLGMRFFLMTEHGLKLIRTMSYAEVCGTPKSGTP